MSYVAEPGGGNLQLCVTGASELFLDQFVISATKGGKACVLCDSTCRSLVLSCVCSSASGLSLLRDYYLVESSPFDAAGPGPR